MPSRHTPRHRHSRRHHHHKTVPARRHRPLRGELCIGAATVLSLISVLLLIFAHVGQINTSNVPRGISMVKVNATAYGDSLQSAIGDPVEGLYNTTPSAPLGAGAGLRNLYAFGLYSHCAYVNVSSGICSNTSIAASWQPFSNLLSDMQANYSGLTEGFIPGNLTFTNSHYLGEFSHAAYYLILLGSICAALAMLTGIPKRTFTFFLATIFALAGTALLLIGVVMWTVIIHKAEDINRAHIILHSQTTATPLGISVSVGPGLWLLWAAWVSLLLSVLPYMISCCTFRG